MGTHAAAFLGAAPACLGAFMAVLYVLVPFALFAAGVAYLGAEATNVPGQLAAASHVLGSEAADRGAIEVELYAASQVLHLRFAKTGSGAMVASLGAGVAGLDAGAELFVSHRDLR